MSWDSLGMSVVLGPAVDMDSLLSGLMILYVGPEIILPLASFLAAIVGVLLMFWHWVGGAFRKTVRFCSRTVKRLTGRKYDGEELDAQSKVNE